MREKGLNLIDASELHHLKPPPPVAEVARIRDWSPVELRRG